MAAVEVLARGRDLAGQHLAARCSRMAPAVLGENIGCFERLVAQQRRQRASSFSAVGEPGPWRRTPGRARSATPPRRNTLQAGGSGSFSISSHLPKRVSA